MSNTRTSKRIKQTKLATYINSYDYKLIRIKNDLLKNLRKFSKFKEILKILKNLK